MPTNQKIFCYACALIILIIIIVFLFLKRQEYFEPQNTLTLANWGKPQPKSCYETLPQKNLFYLPLTTIYSCNACNLNCSTKEAMNRCNACLKLIAEKR